MFREEACLCQNSQAVYIRLVAWFSTIEYVTL